MLEKHGKNHQKLPVVPTQRDRRQTQSKREREREREKTERERESERERERTQTSSFGNHPNFRFQRQAAYFARQFDRKLAPD